MERQGEFQSNRRLSHDIACRWHRCAFCKFFWLRWSTHTGYLYILFSFVVLWFVGKLTIRLLEFVLEFAYFLVLSIILQDQIMIIWDGMTMFTRFAIDGHIIVVIFQVFRGIRWNNLININRHTLFNSPFLELYYIIIFSVLELVSFSKIWRNSSITFKGNMTHSI